MFINFGGINKVVGVIVNGGVVKRGVLFLGGVGFDGIIKGEEN